MVTKRKISGGFLVIVGYILSPLSWWNDLYVNIPLSYGFALIVSRFNEAAFLAAFIGFYWLTNAAGFALMHKGAGRVLRERAVPYGKKDIIRDIALSVGYTILIIVLVKMDIIGPAPSPP
jgi:hypothetical protein